MDNFLNKYGRIFDVLAFIFIIWLFAWTLHKIELPTSPPPLSGDRWGNMSFSDYLTMMGGLRFHQDGFISNYLLSNMTVGFKEFARGWYYYQVPQMVANSAVYYTHYGSLDSVINGVLRNLGVTDLLLFYKIAAFLSSVSLLLWYASASMMFNRMISLVSLVFMGTSAIFLRLMETIASYSYDFFFAFGALFSFLLAELKLKTTKSKNIAYGFAWLLVFLQASNSIEFIIWLGVFFIGYIWITRERLAKGWKIILIMASAPIFGVGLHFVQVAWALGGFQNAITDLIAALARRTTGFELAIEEPFRQFNITEFPIFIETQLRQLVHIEFIGISLLLGLTGWAYWRMKPSLTTGAAKQLWNQWKLLIVFLLGAVIFFILLVQATVTATSVVFRLILPFAGLLFGYSIMVIVAYCLLSKDAKWVRILSCALLLVGLVPPIVGQYSEKPFDFSWHQQSWVYYGRRTEEVEVLCTLIRNSTSYGDIIITNIDTGQTGHPAYPHPAYEYLSQRRIEVARNSTQVVAAVKTLEEIRSKLDTTDPASKVNFFLLIDKKDNDGRFGLLATNIGKLQTTLDAGEWWVQHRGDEPPPMPGSPEKDGRLFYLYKINPHAVDLGYEKTIDNPPTAPELEITPKLPRGNDSLIARIITPSFDMDNDNVTYSYAWYKNGVLQPELDTDTVNSTSIHWGETWKCVVTPNDGILAGPPGVVQVTIDVDYWMPTFIKIPLAPSNITASDFNQLTQRAQNLVDGDNTTYWHVKFPLESNEHWVLLDLEKPALIDILKVKPRLGQVVQLWDGSTAKFQGSNDKQTWVDTANLTVNKKTLPNDTSNWLTFVIANKVPFRYYRLYIVDASFLSLAEIDIYRGP